MALCTARGGEMADEGRQYTAMRERLVMPAGGSVTLAEVAGAGVVSHIFIAIHSADDAGRGGSTIRVFVDGESAPSVETDVDGLVGGFGMPSFKSRYIGCDGLCPGAPGFGGWVYFAMPFARGLRVEMANGSHSADALVFSIISYAAGEPGERGRRRHLRNALIAPAARLRPVAPFAEETLAEATGRGVVHGLVFFLECGEDHWRPLEGNFRFYVDGERAASWESSGTEDYFGGSFYFNGGPFATDWLGAPLLDHAHHRLVGYRFHIPDPIIFDRALRVTWANGEREVGPITKPSLVGGNLWYYTDR
jgi:hypothetical protein